MVPVGLSCETAHAQESCEVAEGSPHPKLHEMILLTKLLKEHQKTL